MELLPSLAFPLYVLLTLWHHSIHEMKQNGKRDSSNLLPKRRVSVLQLPNTRTHEQATAKRVFVSLWALLFWNASYLVHRCGCLCTRFAYPFRL